MIGDDRMEYIRKENDEVIRYNVIYNKDELDKIRFEIIENCGFRIRQSSETEHFWENMDVHCAEFDYIKKPTLAKMIEDFLYNADTRLLDYIYGELIEIDDSDTLDYMQQEKNELLDEVTNIIIKNKYSKIDFDKVKGLINDAERISKDIDVNRNLKDQKKYIPTSVKCFLRPAEFPAR